MGQAIEITTGQKVWAYFFGLVLTPLIASSAFNGLLIVSENIKHGIGYDGISHGDAIRLIFAIAVVSGALNFIPMCLMVRHCIKTYQTNGFHYIFIFAIAGFFYVLIGSLGFAFRIPLLLVLAAVSGALSGLAFWYCVARLWPYGGAEYSPPGYTL